MLSANAESLSAADILAVANDELQTFIVPLLMGVREEFFVATYDQTIVAGTSTYSVPTRAIGAKLRNVYMSDSSGNYFPLARIEPERRWEYGPTGNVAGYIVQANSIVLCPTPTTGQTLRMEYFRRPGTLVATSSACLVSVVTSSVVLRVSGTIPATIVAAAVCDGVKATPTFDSPFSDNTLSTVVSTDLTFASTVGTTAVGDYVCLAGEACVPQIPVELHPLLAQRAVLKIWESQGNPNAKTAKGVADEMAKHALTLITPRVEGGARFVINRSAPGFGRSGRGY